MSPNCSNHTTDSAIPPAARSRVGHGWLDRWLLVVLLATCCVALSNNNAEPDIWGHVQYGRDALAGGLPHFATHTYTAEGFPWINHENLSELALAAGVEAFGMTGLLTIKCALGVLVLCLVIWRARREGAGQLATYGLVLLTAANLVFFWVLRPQLFSFVYFALLATLLAWCFEGWVRELFAIFERHKMSVDVVSTSEVSVSVTVDDAGRLEEGFGDLRQLGDVAVEQGRGIVALVGAALSESSGAMSRAIACIGTARLHMLSLSATGINLTMVVDGDEVDALVRRLHAEFFEGRR